MSVKFASIHGTYNQLEIAIFEDQKCFDSEIKTDAKASSNLIPMLDSLLKKHNLALSDLSFIAVDKGPGAFTSLRVTIATINGIAFQNKIPLIGINSLQALTKQTIETIKPDTLKNTSIIIALLNAYNNDAYFLISKPESSLDSQNQGCQNIDILLDDLKARFKDQKLLFCGHGSQLYKTNTEHAFSDFAQIDENNLLPSAKTIGIMGYHFWIKKENIENQITPLYLKTQYFAIRK
jgi:tRNA threonylcarbamoyladenosine biosynthesis protein TsaB